MVGNLRPKSSRPGRVQSDVVGALLGHLQGDRPAHEVAGQELVHETLASAVAQAPHRGPAALRRSSGRGMAAWWSAVGWNCTNSTSVTGTAGAKRHGYPVAGCLGGIGRDRVHLAGATAGEKDVGGLDPQQIARGVERDDARAAPAVADEIEGEPVLEDRPRRCRAPLRQGPAPPRRPWRCRLREARAPWSARLPCARDSLPPGTRSKTAPRAMSSCTRSEPSSTSTRTAASSQRPAPARRVSARWRSVESSSPGSTAAIPPWAQRVVDCSSSPLVMTPTRVPPRSASRTAAERPATPLPTTRTSRR